MSKASQMTRSFKGGGVLEAKNRNMKAKNEPYNYMPLIIAVAIVAFMAGVCAGVVLTIYNLG
jgi:hypothetical protein